MRDTVSDTKTISKRAKVDFLLFLLFSTVVFFVLLAALLNGGCSAWGFEKHIYDPNGKVIAKVKLSGCDLFMQSDIDKVFYEAKGKDRTLSIGNVQRSPDANSIKEASKGAVGLAGKVLGAP